MAVMDASPARRRWFWPTPAWLVYAAAAATGLFFASERWRWFPVHYQKGWPVLLAVAVVGAVLVLIPAWMLVGLLFRRRVQFGLRTLLVFVTLCAVVCSWFTVRLREARRQAETVTAVQEKPPWQAVYDWELQDNDPRWSIQAQPAPDSLMKYFGVDFFSDIVGLELDRPAVTDLVLPDLAVCSRVTWVWLHGNGVTDAMLSKLGGFTNLRRLDLQETKVTQEGVKKLQVVLPNCHIYIDYALQY